MGLDSLTRRNFLKIAGLAALAGCKSSPLTTLVDVPSKVRIIYFPDYHYPEYVEPAIPYLARFLSENQVDAIALEGLAGEVDLQHFEKIKAAHAHRKHSYDYCWNAITKARKVPSGVGYNNLARRKMMGVDPVLDCCNIEGFMPRAPGLRYALEFYGKIPLFGMEDRSLYDRISLALRLYHEMQLSDECMKPDENPYAIKVIAEHFPLGDYAKSRDLLERELKELPGDVESKMGRFLYETGVHARSVVAVENILKHRQEGTVLMIMGALHEQDILRECKEQGISLKLLKKVDESKPLLQVFD